MVCYIPGDGVEKSELWCGGSVSDLLGALEVLWSRLGIHLKLATKNNVKNR